MSDDSDAALGVWATIGCPRILAFVGGGGKTTLAFRTAQDVCKRGSIAVVTTTTRMLLPRSPEDVDVVITATELSAAQDLLREAIAKGCSRLALVTGSEDSAHGTRVVGVPAEWVPELVGPGLGDVVVVEADGSRKLPFKAPRAPSEPVLPLGVEAVTAVCGIDCLGASICEEQVCRADVVARVASVSIGDTLAPEVVGKVMGQRDLWCHAVPEAQMPRYYAAVNKVSEETREAAEDVARATLGFGHGLAAVLLTGESAGRRGTVLQVCRGSG